MLWKNSLPLSGIIEEIKVGNVDYPELKRILETKVLVLDLLTNREKEILKNSLYFIQGDTYDEFLIAMKFVLANNLLDDDFTEAEIWQSPLIEGLEIRILVFVLISNFFNRGDDRIEDTMPLLPSELSRDKIYYIFSKIALSVAHNDDNHLEKINTFEFLEILVKLINYFEISPEKCLRLIFNTLNNAINCLELLKSNTNYSIKESSQYRRDTIASYSALLAEILLLDKNKKKIFTNFMLLAQLSDDIKDSFEDVDSQLNPVLKFLQNIGVVEGDLTFQDFETLETSLIQRDYLYLENVIGRKLTSREKRDLNRIIYAYDHGRLRNQNSIYYKFALES